jgi:hypothetical protein
MIVRANPRPLKKSSWSAGFKLHGSGEANYLNNQVISPHLMEAKLLTDIGPCDIFRSFIQV